jgi:aspartate/methionine/tyrosine aminotransferase
LAPGIDFDTAEGHGYARLSLAGDTQVIEHALEELDRYLKLA